MELNHAENIFALEAIVLEEVNEIRKKWGKEPLSELPRGVRGDAKECVIARALTKNGATAHVDGETIVWGDPYDPDHIQMPTSEAAGEFIGLFDDGHLPELDEAFQVSTNGDTYELERVAGDSTFDPDQWEIVLHTGDQRDQGVFHTSERSVAEAFLQGVSARH